ncbi:MAG: hypothetical protein H8E66_07425 [Planctomycetes bacterium]|nr:hypothetical protein [Planctomycetota bacterium]
MKKLAVMFALFSVLTLPVAAEDGLNPTSEQLDQAIQQMEKLGIDSSKLPNKDQLKKMLSGENGRRIRALAKKMQQQNPEQFQQIQEKMKQRFDKNGDGALGPKELELAQQAFRQRQSDHANQNAGDHPRVNDRARDHFDRNDDGHLGPHERDAARKAIKLRRSNQNGGQPNDGPSTSDRALNHFDRNSDGQLGPRERAAAIQAQQRRQPTDSQNAIRLKRRTTDSPSSLNGAQSQDARRRSGNQPQAADQGTRPADMSFNRSSRLGGQQPRANSGSRQPQGSRPSPQTSRSNRSRTNLTARSRTSQSSDGASRRSSPTGGANRSNATANRAGASRGGPSARGGR